VKRLLAETADRAARYLAGIGQRRVAPLPADTARLEALGGPLPQSPSDPAEVLALLDDIGSPATVATAGGRYSGFVIGGSLRYQWMLGLRPTLLFLRKCWRGYYSLLTRTDNQGRSAENSFPPSSSY